MNYGIEIEGMGLDIEVEDGELTKLNDFWDSWGFLCENVGSDGVINFYQQSQFEQCRTMLRILKDHYEHDIRELTTMTQSDYNFGLAEIRGEAMRELH